MFSHIKQRAARSMRAISLASLGMVAATASAQSQSDLVNPTGWYWQYNVPLGDAVALVDNENQRVVDLEIEVVFQCDE